MDSVNLHDPNNSGAMPVPSSATPGFNPWFDILFEKGYLTFALTITPGDHFVHKALPSPNLNSNPNPNLNPDLDPDPTRNMRLSFCEPYFPTRIFPVDPCIIRIDWHYFVTTVIGE